MALSSADFTGDDFFGPPKAPAPPKDAGQVPSTLTSANFTGADFFGGAKGVPGSKTTGLPPDAALRESVRLGATLSPEIEARVLKVEQASRNAIPRKYIEENLDEMERATALKSFDPMHFRANSPQFAQWLQGDQRRAALTRKDFDKMSLFEQTVNAWQIDKELADPRYLELKFKELNKNYLSGQEKAEMKMLEERHSALASRVKGASFLPELAGATAYSTSQLADSLVAAGKGAGAAMLVTAPVAAIARSPGLMLTAAKLGALSGNMLLAYQQESAGAFAGFQRERDVTGKLLDEDTARAGAHLVGILNAGIEGGSDALLGYGLGKLIPGVRELVDKLGKAGAKQFVRETTKQLLKNPTRAGAALKIGAGAAGGITLQGAEEFIQNIVTALVGQGTQKASGQEFGPLNVSEMFSEATDDARKAMLGSILTLGTVAGFSTSRAFSKIADAEQNQKVLEAVANLSKNSDTLKVSPEVYQEAVRAIAANGPIKDTYVPVAVWDKLFQEDARAAAQSILGDTKQYDEAKALTGADLVIPMEVYAAKIANTPLHEQIAPEARLQQGGMSAREAAEARGKTDEILAKMSTDAEAAAKLQAPVRQIEQDMAAMVRPFMGDLEAQRVAILQGQRYAVRAARLGVDPLELWKAEAPIVQRDFLGTMSPEALASRENFAEYQSGNMLTTTGKAWENPGDEMAFYTGSGADITSFRPRQAGAVFLSPSPATASEFAYRGTPERGTAGPVYKVHAVAYRPFDYDNPEHVAGIEQAMADVTDREIAMQSASQSLRGFYTNKQQLIDAIRNGAWGAIEHPLVQKAIRANKHDAFWVMEEGVKNIGIYDPKKIKSAIGNRGTYDLTKNNILYQTLPSAVATNVGATADLTDIRIADLDTVKQDQTLFEKISRAILAQTGMRFEGDPTIAIEEAINRMVDNLLWLHDQVPAEVRARSKLWYDGAQEFAARWAQRWNKTLAQTAGMLATLSPQKDWFMNATMGERVGDILDTQMDFAWSDRMSAASFRFLAAEFAEAGPSENKTAFALIQGKTLREVTTTGNQRAVGMWIRAYDEAYNSSAHAIVSPEGQFQGNVLTGSGKEARRAWGDFESIGKAASIFLDGSPENISRQIGNAHKVRNFYNNIFNASDPRFITIDTHAVAAAHLRPFAGSDRAVMNNFGNTATSAVLGIYGTYPIYFEAYKRAAATRGLIPREMQSITWEAGRALFPDTFKTKENKDAIEAIWAQVDAGTLTVRKARNQIKRLVLGASPLPAPEWFAGRVESTLLRDRTYAGDRAPHHGVQINFEVAPDPRNEDLTARWTALLPEVQQRVSADVAWNVVAKAMAAFDDINLKGELHVQLGGWMGATNPSFGLWLDPNVSKARAVMLARLLGHALRQQSMSVVSANKFPGGKPMGAIVIQGVDDLLAGGIYQDLQATFGADVVEGHTTNGGAMVILTDDMATADGLGAQIAAHLGEAYNVQASPVYGSFIGSEDSYGLPRDKTLKGSRAGSSLREVGDQLRREAAEQVEAYLRQGDPDSPGGGVTDAPRVLRQEDPVNGYQFSRDGNRWGQGGSFAPLPGAPVIKGATGPDPGLVAVAERYAADAGIRLTRQSEYVRVDEARARRIAAAYEAMPHAPQDPKVKEAYADLIRQTRAQYDALIAAGYEFTFFDDSSDPYQGNPWNAMRDLRANRRMAVYGTYSGYGTDITTTESAAENPMLTDTGLEWADQDGVMHKVTANDLFRAVHDAFGHGLEGAGFRGQGEENAWQAHARLFTGPALGALASETRGQNSWLNFGPYGEANQTAKVEDTVFAEQKTGLMPEWTWTEGRLDDGPLLQRSGAQQTTVRGQFQPAPAGQRPLITLFKSANPSTIYHELSHSWLEELRRDAEGPFSTPQLKADWESIKRLSGMENLQPGQAIPRASHEWFARNSEAYVRDGKAPSVELRSVFAQFAQWLKQIYKSIRQLIGEDEINPEFRGVMDRLLATDEQIATAREESGQSPMAFEDLTEAENAAYMKQVEAVRQEAEERVRAETMAELVRERKSWWRNEKAQVTREVEEAINARPEYQVASWLRTGRLLDGSAPDLPHQRLDRQAVAYQYGEDMVRKLAFMVQAEGGLHPDLVAEAFGFDSGDAMLKAITEAAPRRQAINAEVDRIMAERHGDMLNDGGLAERAIAAVHSDKQADVLLTELRILRRLGAKGQPTTWAELQKLAAEIAGRLVVGDLNPKHYVGAGARMAHAAETAMVSKDYTSAYNAKMRQLINLAMVQETTKLKAAYEKALKGWKLRDQQSDEKLSKGYDLNLVNTARAILGAHGIGRQGERALDYLKLVEEYDPKTAADMTEVVQLATENAKPVSDMTSVEFTQMKEIVDGIWVLARNTRKSLIDGQRVDLQAIKDELAAGVQSLGRPEIQRGVKKAVSELEKFNVGLLDARAHLVRLEHWFAAMDRHIPGAPFTKYLWRPIQEAADRYRTARTAVLTQLRELAKTMDGRITRDPIEAPEIGYQFTNRAELLAALAHTGNESNKSKLLRGGRPGHPWGELREDGTLDSTKWDTFIKNAIDAGTLTKVDFDFVQGLWDLMESLKPAIQAAHKEMYGYYFPEVEATAFTTPWGTYRGGYMPAIVDPFLDFKARERADKAAVAPKQATFAWPTTGRGATKARIESYAAPLQLDIRLVQQHIDWALRFAHIEPRVREAARVVMSKDFRDPIEKYVDTEIISKAIVPWLDRAATQQVEHPSEMFRFLDSAARFLRSNTALQIMSGNLSNTLQNVTGFASALTKVKGKHLRGSFYTYISAPLQTAEAVRAASPFMRERMDKSAFDVQREINQFMLDPSLYRKARENSAKYGYLLQQTTQNFMDVIIWRGAYNQAQEANLSVEESVRRADAAVRLTQGDFNPESLSRFETGSAIKRLFTMFTSYFINQSNLLGFEAGDAYANKSWKQALHLYFFIVLPTAVIAEAIAQAMSGELWDDDDDDGYLDNFLSVFFGGQAKLFTAMVPIVGQGAMAAINAWNDKRYDDRVMSSPGVAVIETAARTPVSVYNAVVNDGSWKRAIKDSLTTIGVLTGLPFGVLARPLGYMADVEQGRVDPANAADYARGLVTGR